MDANVLEAVVTVVVAIAGLLGAVITYVVVPLIRTHTTQKQRETAYGIVEAAVGMAEQLGRIHGWNGNEKYIEARTWSIRQLNDAGFELDDATINGWIEDAVSHLESFVDLTMEPEHRE